MTGEWDDIGAPVAAALDEDWDSISDPVPAAPAARPKSYDYGTEKKAYEDQFGPDANLRADEGRSFLQGLTSWGDEGVAALRAIPEAVTTDRDYGDVYADKVGDERAGLDRLKEFNPDARGNLENLGIGASMALPAFAYDKLRKAGIGAKKAFSVVGAGTGAAYGSGAADVKPEDSWPEAVQKRGESAVKPAAIGAVAAPLMAGLGEKVIGPVSTITSKAFSAVANPANAAYSRLQAKLGEGGISKLLDDIATTGVEKRTLSVLGEEMVKANGDKAAAEAAMIQRVATEFNILPGTVKANLSALRSRFKESRLMLAEYPAVADAERVARTDRTHAGPSIDAVSKIDETDAHWTLDHLANKGFGKSARDTRNAINTRARSANQTMADDIQKMSPNGQTIQDTATMISRAEKQASADYKHVLDPALGLIDNAKLASGIQGAVQKHRGTWADRLGEQSRAIEDALSEFLVKLPNGQTLVMPTMQQAMDARGALRGIISRNAQVGNNHIVQALKPLYDDVTNAMRASSSEWSKVNDRWADKAIAEKVNELGEAFSKKAGPKYREQKAEFDLLDPGLKDIVRIQYLQKLQDDLDNAVKMGSTTKFFNNNHTYKALEDLFDRDTAVDFARRVRDSNVEEMSKNMAHGSQTHRRQQAQKMSDGEEALVAATQAGDVRGWKEKTAEIMKGILTERSDKATAKIATSPMSDVSKTAEHLERMRRAPERDLKYKGRSDRIGRRMGRGAQTLLPRAEVQSHRQEEETRSGYAHGGEVEYQAAESMTQPQQDAFPDWVLPADAFASPKSRMEKDDYRPFSPDRPEFLPVTPDEKMKLHDLLRRERIRMERDYPDKVPEYMRRPPAPGSQFNLGDNVQVAEMTAPRMQAGVSFGAGQVQDGERPRITQDDRQRMKREIADQMARGVSHDEAFRSVYKSGIAPVSGYDDGGHVRKSYDYTPEDDLTNTDLARYSVGRGLRRDGTGGIGNRLSAEVESRMEDEPVDDILRRYRDIDTEFEQDYPWGSAALDGGSAIAGGVLAGGALRGTGSIANRLLSAPMNFNTKRGMAAAAGSASLGDTYMNEPDATKWDYVRDAIIPAAATVPMAMGAAAVPHIIDAAVDGVKRRVKGVSRKADDAEFMDLGSSPRPDPGPGSPKPPSSGQSLGDADAMGRDLGNAAAERGEQAIWKSTAPAVYKKPHDYYPPDMPNAKAIEIKKPTAGGFQKSTPREDTAANYESLYAGEGEIPSHVKNIRQNSASQYINEKGQYVLSSDAMIFERMKKRGLLQSLPERPRPVGGQSLRPPKPKPD